MVFNKFRTVSLALALLMALAVLKTGSAEARRLPEDVFAGKIMTSKKRFPTGAKSVSTYIKKVKKQTVRKFQEDTKKKSWKIYFAAFFQRPLDDMEATIKIYDLSSGKKRLIAAFEQYLSERGQRTLVSNLILERERFGVNKELLITIENSRSKVIAKGTVRILGKAETFSGKVEFSEEEAN